MIYFPSIDPNDRKALASPSPLVEMISFEQLKLRHLSHPSRFVSFPSLFFSSIPFVDLDETRYEEKPKADDIAVIMYTSGSTGVPKGLSLPLSPSPSLSPTVSLVFRRADRTSEHPLVHGRPTRTSASPG